MKTNIKFDLPQSTLRVGILEAFNVAVKASSQAYKGLVEDEVKPFAASDYIYSDKMQKGVRSLLKTWGYHPSGRSRPASEFLFKDLQNRGSFNFINNIVDINNHVSLMTNLPISVFDMEKSGTQLCLRVGGDDEEYVFNREGQVLSLKKLLVVAKQSGEPIGSPVKDCQATKVFEPTKSIVFVVYSSSTLTSKDEMNGILEKIGKYLVQEASATDISMAVLDA